MKKYWSVVITNIQAASIYRARNFIWICVDAFTLLVMPFVWMVVYSQRETVGGLRLDQTITYLVGAVLLQLLVSSHFESRVRKEIAQGSVSSFLLKPINHFLFCIFRETGWRISRIYFFFPVFVGVPLLFHSYLVAPPEDAVIPFLVSLFFSWLLFSIFNYLISLSAFFFVESDAVADLFWFCYALFSGMMAPLSFFPPLIQKIADLLPFPYLLYFPLSVYLGTLQHSEIISGIAMQAVWSLVLGAAVAIIFPVALRKYEGVGI